MGASTYGLGNSFHLFLDIQKWYGKCCESSISLASSIINTHTHNSWNKKEIFLCLFLEGGSNLEIILELENRVLDENTLSIFYKQRL